MIKDFFEDVILMEKVTESDSVSGVSTAYVDGETIRAGILAVNRNDTVRVAGQSGKNAMYTVMTDMSVKLSVGDRIRRVMDGTVMTVTSDPADRSAPSPASEAMQFHCVRAEAIAL